MTDTDLRKKQKRFSIHTRIQCLIWAAAVCMMTYIFCISITPVYTQEYLNSVHPFHTSQLHPGDSASQSFRSSHDFLDSAGIALSYGEDIPDDASVLFQVLSGEEVILEQTLSLRYCPDSRFCNLILNLENCQDEIITIYVKNISPDSEKAVFTLLATDKDYLYSDNTENYFLNGEEQNARLLLFSSYKTGVSCYRALTYSFWIFLAALMLSGLLSRHFRAPIIADSTLNCKT